MDDLHLVTFGAVANAVADVIFIHGLGGDKFGTWQASTSSEGFWPAWLSNDLPGIAVYTMAYEASFSGWLGNAMPLGDRAINVLACLEADELGKRPLIFVCHKPWGFGCVAR
jgi:hypothetical protein